MCTKDYEYKSFQLGRSTAKEEGLTEAHFQEYAEAGVKELELSFPPQIMDGLCFPKIKQFADCYGVHLWSLHLPFHGPLDMSALEVEIRNHSIAYYRELIAKGTDIGISHFILHPSKEPIGDSEREERMKCAVDSLTKMAQAAAEYGGTIAVEDLPRTCLGRNSAEMKRLLEADDRLRVCFDTNHLLKQPIKEFIRDLGNRIITTHISDYDFVDERHWMPGEGMIDWAELLNELEAVGYQGPVMYEVATEPSRDIDRRALTSKDFRANYECLIKRLRPEPIGKPLV